MTRTSARLAARFNRVGLGSLNQVAKRVIRRVRGDKLTIKSDGLVIEGPVAGWRTMSQIASGEYEKTEVRLFNEAVSPGLVVVDIGANVGYYALMAARRV